MRRIFELCAEGDGLTRIAKPLNAEGRRRRARSRAAAGWAPSSVREVLYPAAVSRRDRLEPDAQARPLGPAAAGSAGRRREWLRVPAPELRIVSETSGTAAHARLDGTRRSYERGTHGVAVGAGRPGFAVSAAGFARCARAAAAGFASRSRSHGSDGERFLRLHGASQARTRRSARNGLVARWRPSTGRFSGAPGDVICGRRWSSARSRRSRELAAQVQHDDGPTAATRAARPLDTECRRARRGRSRGRPAGPVLDGSARAGRGVDELSAAAELRTPPRSASIEASVERRLRGKSTIGAALLTGNVEEADSSCGRR